MPLTRARAELIPALESATATRRFDERFDAQREVETHPVCAPRQAWQGRGLVQQRSGVRKAPQWGKIEPSMRENAAGERTAFAGRMLVTRRGT